jgi:hypothetical protein
MNGLTVQVSPEETIEQDASRLADRPYLVMYDHRWGGIVCAYHPEFERDGIRFCVGRGRSQEEAVIDLRHERYQIILQLVRAGYPVPEPGQDTTRYFTKSIHDYEE